jgi:hypothetical protein
MKAVCAWLMAAVSIGAAADDRVCATCHREIVAKFRATPMARALVSVADCDILKRNPELTYREPGYDSRIVREGDRSILKVTGGGETLTVPLLWAFGRGQAGQTYVFERGGVWYESRISFYNALNGVDLTMGAQPKPGNLEDAAGHKMGVRGAGDCFNCHSMGAEVSGTALHLDAIVPGVGCESCHGPAEKHVTAIRVGDAAGAKMPHLAAKTAEEMSDMCGRCHRTWSQIALSGPRGVLNVRFQPYRLANSRCYDTADARIRCSACHDPHGPLDAVAAGYDSKCQACHTAKTKMCTVAKSNCVSCHMPKIDLPGAHAKFTDHQIRIVRAGSPYPN